MTTTTPDRIREELRRVPEPCGILMREEIDIVAMGLVDEISYVDGDVRIVLVLTDASCVHFTGLRRYIGDVVGALPGVDSVTVTASTTDIWTPDRRTTTVEQTLVPTPPRRANPMALIAPSFDDYATKYENIRLERDESGILQVTIHSDGKPAVWTAQMHDELAYCFGHISTDAQNAVVVLTGAGDSFCAEIDFSSFNLGTATDWSQIIFEGQRLLNNLLAIEVPVIAAINGPALIHPEIPILSDITIAADTATFADGPHFPSGIVPGDGAHTVWTHVLGPQRGPYFLLTGQELDATLALEYGVVNEVLPLEQVLPRARELAAQIAAKPPLARRYARAVLTREWKRLMHEQLGFGLAHEALAALSLGE